MAKRLPDEILIDALLSFGSIKAAAAAIGCTEGTFYKRMKQDTFTQKYKLAKHKCVEATVNKLQYASLSAVNTLTTIMEDPEVAPQVRINAANAVLNHAAKFTENVDILDRLEELEAERERSKGK